MMELYLGSRPGRGRAADQVAGIERRVRLTPAVLPFLALLEHAVLFRMLFAFEGSGWTVRILVATLVLLAALSATRLWRSRTWGFLAFYLLALFATVAFSISLVPLVTAAAPPELRPWTMAGLNLILILIAAILHRRARSGGTA